MTPVTVTEILPSGERGASREFIPRAGRLDRPEQYAIYAAERWDENEMAADGTDDADMNNNTRIVEVRIPYAPPKRFRVWTHIKRTYTAEKP